MDLIIRTATMADASTLSEMAQLAYRQHFSFVWDPPLLEKFLEQENSISFFQKLLLDPNCTIFIAHKNQKNLGYLILLIDRSLSPLEPGGAQIKRIYLLKEAVNQGIGKQLMQQAMHFIQSKAKAYIWLDVMQISDQSIAFYQRLGFQIIQESRFTLFKLKEDELAKMYIMKKNL